MANRADGDPIACLQSIADREKRPLVELNDVLAKPTTLGDLNIGLTSKDAGFDFPAKMAIDTGQTKCTVECKPCF